MSKSVLYPPYDIQNGSLNTYGSTISPPFKMIHLDKKPRLDMRILVLVRSTINLYCNDPEVERIWYGFNFATEKKEM